jgi:hypothetical protein
MFHPSTLQTQPTSKQTPHCVFYFDVGCVYAGYVRQSFSLAASVWSTPHCLHPGICPSLVTSSITLQITAKQTINQALEKIYYANQGYAAKQPTDT